MQSCVICELSVVSPHCLAFHVQQQSKSLWNLTILALRPSFSNTQTNIKTQADFRVSHWNLHIKGANLRKMWRIWFVCVSASINAWLALLEEREVWLQCMSWSKIWSIEYFSGSSCVWRKTKSCDGACLCVRFLYERIVKIWAC